MLKNVQDPKDLQNLLLALLSTSGTLAGISLALVGIVNLKIGSQKVETIADDLFLLASLGFLIADRQAGPFRLECEWIKAVATPRE